MEKHRILVVDDQPGMTGLLKTVLEKRGYQVLTENDPAKALETARGFNPDFVLLDVDMPELDGGDVAALLAKDPQLKKTPVAFLTSLISAEEAENQTRRGGIPILSKPARMDKLHDHIQKTMNAARVEDFVLQR